MQSPIYKQLPAEEIIRIELELTSSCNLKCPLCIRTTHNFPKTHNFRPLKEIVDQLEQYTNLKYITLAGAISEPTLHPEFFEIIKYIKKRDLEISLYINGDTKLDPFYIKLGVLFREARGNVYFTMCGTTQELHERYRVGSKLDRVLHRLEIVNRYSGNKGILTWIVFDYNEQDFEENYQKFKEKYRTEYFYTLPMAEHFELKSTIKLPERLSKIYTTNIDRTDFENITCPANKNKFLQITYNGKTNPCSLYRLYGEQRCFECSKKNLATLRNNKIFNVAEAESEDSEISLRLYYENPNEKK
jgi:MoaA/NifB/PqqE/SkfB family radical SAM enzyme